MDTKTVEYAGKEWVWPAYDEKLLQVNDWADDIDLILSHVSDFSACIQAGGACGIWPWMLSVEFQEVYTFEPDLINFECLIANTGGVSNIISENAALSDKEGVCNIVRDAFEKQNCGAGYMVPSSEGVPTRTIDSLELNSCGLIQLDVEGFEGEALTGGIETLRTYRPVVVVEEKPLPHAPGKEGNARKILKGLGYKEVAQIHRDVIFVC